MGFAVLAATLLLLLWIGARNIQTLVLTTVALGPWTELAYDPGLRFTAYMLGLIALIALVVARATQPGWRPPPVPGATGLAIIALVAIVGSLLQMAFLPEVRLGLGAGRSTAIRAPTQILMFLLQISPALLVPWLIRTREGLVGMARAYAISVLILVVLGWIQIVIWYGTGYNLFPVNAFSIALGSAIETREGVQILDKLNIYRMNALAGEPRALGYVLVVVMLILQARALSGAMLAPGERTRNRLIWLICLVSLATTISTSAIAYLVIGSAVQLLLPPFIGWLPAVRPAALARIGALVLAPVLVAGAAAEAAGVPVTDILAARTIERVDKNGAVEDFDLAINGYLAEHPAAILTGKGLGNIHLYATRYLLPEHAAYAEGRIFTAKQFWLRYVSEIGVVGFAAVILWFAGLVILLVMELRRKRGRDPLGLLVPLAICAGVIHMAGGVMADFFFTAGALSSAIAVLRRERGA